MSNPLNSAMLEAAGFPKLSLRYGRATTFTAIPLGDSITIGASSVTSNGMSVISGGIALSKRCRILRNAGVSGNTVAQVEARIDADAIAYAPDFVPLLIGPNNLASGMTNANIGLMMDGIERMIVKLLNAGILPILITPPPKDAAPAEAKKVQYLYYMLAEYYHIPLFDLYRLWVDPVTGNYSATDYLDGTHPSLAAIQKGAAAFGAMLDNLTSWVNPPYLAAVAETVSTNVMSNVLRNGNFANAISASNWTITTPAGSSYTTPDAVQPYTGKELVYVRTDGTNGTAAAGFIIYLADGSFAVGDEIEFNTSIKVENNGGDAGFNLNTAVNLGGSVLSNNYDLSGWKLNGEFLGHTRFTVPATADRMISSLVLTAEGTYTMRNVTVVNRTKAKAVWQPGVQ